MANITEETKLEKFYTPEIKNKKKYKNIEIWKDIPGYLNKYQASNLGNIKSLSRIIENNNGKQLLKDRILNQSISSNTYYMVSLSDGVNVKKYCVHQLIAMTFLNHKPNKFEIVVDHINENKLDNNLINLRLVSNRINSTGKKYKNSKYKGVCYSNTKKIFQSYVRIDGEKVYLYSCKDDEELCSKYYEMSLLYLNEYNGNKKQFRDFLKSKIK